MEHLYKCKADENKPKTQEGGIDEDIGGGASAFLEIFIKGGEDGEYRSVFMNWNSHLSLYTTET